MKKILSFLLIFITCIFLSSCMGGGSSSEELYLSKAILLEDGSTEYILYNYYGDEIGRFVVPAPIKGEDGATGNGIISIVPTPSEDGLSQTITVTFTDETMEPVEFTVQNGISVVGVVEHIDEETGEKYILLQYSDGNTSEEPIYLPKGDDGNGIDDFKYDYNEDTNRIYLYISFTNEELMEDIYYDFPAPKDGNGIEWMNAETKEVEGVEKYVITIKYTDQEEPIEFPLEKPADPNKWYNSTEYPNKDIIPNMKQGDFYFDISNQQIFIREGSKWRPIVDFKTSEQTYTVQFELNLPEGEKGSFVIGKDYYDGIKYGTYGLGIGIDIPMPYCEGYNFVGWSVKRSLSQTTGFFTDLTPVLSNLTLYAIWEPIEVSE